MGGSVGRIDDRRPAILPDEIFARWHWARGHVENVAAAIVFAVQDERAAGRVFNVADPRRAHRGGLGTPHRRGRRLGRRVVALSDDQLPESLRQPYDFSRDYTADSSRIRREHGYVETVNEEDALRRTIEWERANPLEARTDQFDYQAEEDTLATVSGTH